MQNAEMLAMYNCELESWEEYVREKWREVEKKKQEAANLRDSIARQNQNLVSQRRLLAEEEERLSKFSMCKYQEYAYKRQLQRVIRDIQSAISQTEATLRRTLAMPSFLVRPLPPAKCDAIQVISC
ncbi:hypothetical protein PsorP6_005449 [Peronosclerospora sorghi]|uniref:Uncharacterized protein n=2 Tax=Peronosclerospora sorghi TaxID=230839 RepID=A0ACC0W5R6_9STRA|nr:hypothetical protein PsorP6_005465 [Peronosclerospora sorghi]KAI9913453.1 hypothetical protein PsorP6_005449 [Peronosclerospora sorghi]